MAKKTIKQLADKKSDSFGVAEKKKQLMEWLQEQGFKPRFNNSFFKLETKLQVVIKITPGNEEFILNSSYRQYDGNWSEEDQLTFFYSAYPDISFAFKQVRKVCKRVIRNAQM